MINTKIILLSLFLLTYGFSIAQKNESCNVLLNEISGSYKGDCKDNLADGKGVAKGVDVYSGKFKNGLPDGKGKYTYKNGNVFTGYFKKGLKNGEGKFIYSIAGKSYTQKGYWVNGDYVGLTNPEEFYRISIQYGVDDFVINKLNKSGNKLKISFIWKILKYVPKGLKIKSSSGQITQLGKDFIVTNGDESNFIEIEYVVTKGGINKVCQLSFEVLENGSYEARIINE